MDYKGIFVNEDLGFKKVPTLSIYSVYVIHKETKVIVWSGEVEATTNLKACLKWRKENPDLRAKYKDDYQLAVKRINTV